MSKTTAGRRLARASALSSGATQANAGTPETRLGGKPLAADSEPTGALGRPYPKPRR